VTFSPSTDSVGGQGLYMPFIHLFIGDFMPRKTVDILKADRETLILKTTIGTDYRFSIPKAIRSFIDPNEKVRITIKRATALPGERLRYAIILAAGKGDRMGSYLPNYPKALIEVEDRTTILDVQIRSLVECGFDPSNIIVVMGHLYDTVSGFLDRNHPSVSKIVYTLEHEDHELMGSLRDGIVDDRFDIHDGCIVLYGDIVYDTDILREVSRTAHNISLVIDTNPDRRYRLRNAHVDTAKNECDHQFNAEAEKVWVDNEDRICYIGKSDPKPRKCARRVGEYAGIMKISRAGMEIFRAYMDKYSQDWLEKSLLVGKHLTAIYLADFLQYMIDSKTEAHRSIGLCCLDLDNRLYEFDTPSDIKAWKMYRRSFVWDQEGVL